MLDFPFLFGSERIAFSDEYYGVIGRALAFGQRFEGNCRTLATIIKLRTNPEILLERDEDYQNFCKIVDKLWSRILNQQIESLSQYFEFTQDTAAILRKGREARNIIAHEITLGIQHYIETDDGRAKIIKDVETEVRKIAEADRIICFLAHIVNKEPLPASDYIQDYCDMVANWVCEVEDNY